MQLFALLCGYYNELLLFSATANERVSFPAISTPSTLGPFITKIQQKSLRSRIRRGRGISYFQRDTLADATKEKRCHKGHLAVSVGWARTEACAGLPRPDPDPALAKEGRITPSDAGSGEGVGGCSGKVIFLGGWEGRMGEDQAWKGPPLLGEGISDESTCHI